MDFFFFWEVDLTPLCNEFWWQVSWSVSLYPLLSTFGFIKEDQYQKAMKAMKKNKKMKKWLLLELNELHFKWLPRKFDMYIYEKYKRN